MANNQNYKLVLGLDTSRFGTGLKKAQVQLERFKGTLMSFAGALGAGLGFGALISNLKDTVVELSTANATLKNTFMNSATNMAAYGESVEFLRKLARDYKQDILELTSSFAAFHAAADSCNVSLEDQRKVYESLVKAAAYFHLSSERTHDMMVAVEQMFSKGKVSAEELRRQLGNNLPGAFGIMAKAMGVTTAKLDDMIKKGEVYADEVLPKFADELNRITNNIDLSSLQLAMNQLKNSWTELANSSNFEQFFAGVIGKATSALEKFRQNLDSIKTTIKVVFSAVLIQKFVKGYAQLASSTAVYKQAMLAADEAAKQHLGTIGQIKAAWNASSAAAASAGKQGVSVFASLIASVKSFGAALKGVFMSNIIGILVVGIGEVVGQISNLVDEAKKAKNYFNELEGNMKNALNKVTENSEKRATELKQYVNILKSGSASIAEKEQAIANLNSELGLQEDALLTLKDGWDAANTAVENYIGSMKKQAMAEVYAAKIAELKIELEQKKSDLANYKPGFWRKIGDNVADMLTIGMGFEGVMTTGDDQIRQQIAAIEKSLRIYDGELRQIIEERLRQEAAEAEARKEAAEKAKEEAKAKKRYDELKKDPLFKILDNYKKETEKLRNQKKAGAITEKEYQKALDNATESAGKGIYGFSNLNEQVKAFGDDWVAVANQIKSAFAGWLDRNKYSEAVKEMEKYSKSIEELNNQNEQGVYTSDEYKKEVASLVVDTYKAVSALGDLDDIMAHLPENLRILLEAIRGSFEGAKTSLEKTPSGSTKKLKTGADLGKISTYGYDRDGRYDFTKSRSGIFESMHDEWERVADSTQKALDKIENDFDKTDAAVIAKIAELNKQLEEAIANADTLGQAAALAKWKEQVDELQIAYGKGVYSAIKDTATALDRVRTGWESLKKTWEDDDATPFDMFIVTLNETFQLLDTLMGLVEAFNTISQLNDKLSLANRNEKLAQMAQELALQEALNAAIKEQADAEVTAAAASAINTAAAQAETSAESGKAIAGATAAGASIPFPYNLIAIASGVAAVIAALASISKFADGGIVGGNSKHGDKVLARVNSGEGILTAEGVRNLSRLYNNQGLGGQVEFKIKGSDLVGTIKNYNQTRKG